RGHHLKVSSAWQGSPVQAVIEGGDERLHCRLDDAAMLARFPLLSELAAEGARDYLIYRLDYSASLAAGVDDPYWRRQWISFTTDDETGFTPQHEALFESL